MACRAFTHGNNFMCLMNYFPQELTKTFPEGEWLEICYPRFLHCTKVLGRLARVWRGIGFSQSFDFYAFGCY